MIAPPKCYERDCVYYLGMLQPDGTELTEVPHCHAFPKGIPSEIAYGNNKHTAIHPDQEGTFVFQKRGEEA